GGRIVGIDRRRNLVRYRARPAFAGKDRFVVARRSRGVRWRTVVSVTVHGAPQPKAPRPSPPTCKGEAERTNYETPVRLSVTCRGTEVAPLTITGGPSHGALQNIQRSGNGNSRTLAATYIPDDLFVGNDALRVEGHNAGGHAEGTAGVEVRPWRMRALGDSATAGFGFLGDGTEITSAVLLSCSPPETFNNDRCSSNSPEGPGYEGPIKWSADFGLANDVSWAAQFANRWQGGGHITAPVMFQNHAVTGSTPAEWLPGGVLHEQLAATVAEDPDLVAFTLGVNPLLNRILVQGEGEACIKGSTDVAALVACIEPIFQAVALRPRLEAIYAALLTAPDAKVVTFQYHDAYPAISLIHEFQPWQVEALINHLNAEIAAAVSATRTSLPAQGSRLTLIEAQVDPAAPDPLKVARFNVGVPADPNQTWTGSFTCGGAFTVDGPSHQSTTTQEALPAVFENKFCPGEPWTISADTGIHPNRAGYAQFAQAMIDVAAARDLVPQLP
ncbi:MAG TPA: hypothetical protein VHE08_08540, partial [Solirubrobacterales bacterium]|nr:hypothetical protein [Solirubrobacterales bacterium]